MASTRIPTGLIGHAGEHYVMFELYRRGLMAALAPFGTEIADILVLRPDGTSVGCSLQVKTRTGRTRRPSWVMHAKHETYREPGLLYVFVDLAAVPPAVFIVPSEFVASSVKLNHQVWLAGAPTRGSTRTDTPMRKITSFYPDRVPGFPEGWMEMWRDRWDLIEHLSK